MHAEQNGLLKITEPLVSYYPQYKGDANIEDLLRHRGNFPPGLNVSHLPSHYKDALQVILQAKSEEKNKFVYSDLGFILLGNILRELSHSSNLNEVFQPFLTTLQTKNTCYTGENCLNSDLFVGNGTEIKTTLRPHDPIARAFPEMAGNAGIFSSTADIVTFIQAVLGDQNPLLTDKSKEKMKAIDSNGRALGWDRGSSFADSIRGPLPPTEFLGHTGYTGTSIGIDLKRGYYIILLTNRVQGRNGDSEASRSKMAALRAAIYSTIFSEIKSKNP